MDIILESERLLFCNLTKMDKENLKRILQDPEVMYAYEHAFQEQEVNEWLDRQLDRYKQYGFGLWAVLLKETGEFIGQAGLTIQECQDDQVLEIGYLFCKEYWHQGYATEAAKACKQYAFEVLKRDKVYSIIRDTNLASKQVALRNGMKPIMQIVKHYYNIDMPHDVYCVSKK